MTLNGEMALILLYFNELVVSGAHCVKVDYRVAGNKYTDRSACAVKYKLHKNSTVLHLLRPMSCGWLVECWLHPTTNTCTHIIQPPSTSIGLRKCRRQGLNASVEQSAIITDVTE